MRKYTPFWPVCWVGDLLCELLSEMFFFLIQKGYQMIGFGRFLSQSHHHLSPLLFLKKVVKKLVLRNFSKKEEERWTILVLCGRGHKSMTIFGQQNINDERMLVLLLKYIPPLCEPNMSLLVDTQTVNKHWIQFEGVNGGSGLLWSTILLLLWKGQKS